MCHRCNYDDLLAAADLEATANRLRVLEVVGNNSFPLSAGDIFKTLERSSSINRVTIYRILDLLVELLKGLVECEKKFVQTFDTLPGGGTPLFQPLTMTVSLALLAALFVSLRMRCFLNLVELGGRQQAGRFLDYGLALAAHVRRLPLRDLGVIRADYLCAARSAFIHDDV